ncbi:MAG: hypothetical protein ACI30H_00205 [Paludibacteraceae bacterium]
MKAISFCFVGRHRIRLLCVLALLLTTSFACAGGVPVPLLIDDLRPVQVDSLERARHKERMDRLKADLQNMHTSQSRGLSNPKNRSVMRLVTLLMILLNWLIVKMAKYKNEVVETNGERSSEHELPEQKPIADVADLGMRSKMILRMLLLAVVWVIGVALLVVCSTELATCLNIWQPMIEQGFDPKLLLKDLILNCLGVFAGVVLQLVGVWYFFRIRTLLRQINAESDDGY